MTITLYELRRFTIVRNFFPPTTLKRAIHNMGFVQADPIRAPARAQDLILRQRVKNYLAGDLELRYSALDIDEDVFVNYGFVTRTLQSLMHPRAEPAAKPGVNVTEAKREKLLLEFVRERGAVHPRQVDEHFAHGRVTNFWGGSSNATTQLLEAMHYRGLLRVARREKGIRIYCASERELTPPSGRGSVPNWQGRAGSPAGQPRWGARPARDHSQDARATVEKDARIDELVDTVVRIYAPLPSASLSYYVRRLRYAVPQWSDELPRALQRAKERLSHATVAGVEWFWAKENGENALRAKASRGATEDRVRFLAPFDPVVHDRSRFELLWGWAYRFEAYTPLSKRKLGYYALPLLWRDHVIGWANLAVKTEDLSAEIGYVNSQPRERAFKRELEAELDRVRKFLRLGD